MSENKLILKDDINFLEYPNWLLDEKTKIKEYILEKENGTYKLSTASDTLPTRFDKIVLYYLLHELFKTTKLNSTKLITTRYKIARNVFNPPPDAIPKNLKKVHNVGKIHYDRIMLALERWSDIAIKFEGIFYEGDNYTTRFFHIIDNVKLDHTTRELAIKFNDDYIKQLKETKFYKYIDFDEYKKLTKPISARLYEILIKTFKDRYIWQIDIIKLAEKLTLSEIYPAHILPKLKPAINEINNKTDLKIKLEYNEEKRICTFIKVENDKKTQEVKYNEKLQELLNLLPIELSKQESVRNLLNKYLTEKGVDYVRANILYSTQNSKKNLKVYLKNALRVDWGEEDRIKKQERLNQQELRNRQEQEKKLQEAEKAKAKDEQIEKYMQYFKALSKQEQQDILNKINNDASIKCIPFEGVKIMTYLKNRENIKL